MADIPVAGPNKSHWDAGPLGSEQEPLGLDRTESREHFVHRMVVFAVSKRQDQCNDTQLESPNSPCEHASGIGG
jgi:hypothetical protein